MATIVERHTISSSRGVGVVEERDMVMLSEARAGAASATLPPAPAQAAWRQVVEPNPVLLFRFSAIRFNSHRIHYDRDYVTKVEKLPGLVVQSSLISQLMMEMCRKELPARPLASFDFKSFRQIYDTGSFTIAGNPAADRREAQFWALDGGGRLAISATAKFGA